MPRSNAAAWLCAKRDAGYEIDLKVWSGLWLAAHQPDGTAIG